jgi:malate dehydrogenase (quinone)
MPLVMNNRQEDEKIAATYMDIGTDVNFWSLTSQLIKKETLKTR